MDTEDNINLRVASFSYYLDTAKDNLVQRITAQENPVTISSGRTVPATAKPRSNTSISLSHYIQRTHTALPVL